jgi:hypothetical protein
MKIDRIIVYARNGTANRGARGVCVEASLEPGDDRDFVTRELQEWVDSKTNTWTAEVDKAFSPEEAATPTVMTARPYDWYKPE